MNASKRLLANPPDRLVERRLQLTTEGIRRYGSLTEDPNPIHYDPVFAAKTPFGKPIAQGTFTLNALWAAVTATFGPDGMAGMVADLRFVKPVIENDSVTGKGERVATNPPTYHVAVLDSAGVSVVEGRLIWPDLDSAKP